MTDAHYRDHLEKAPVFTKGEIQEIRGFIKKFIRKGDQNNLIYQIEKRKNKFITLTEEGIKRNSLWARTLPSPSICNVK